MASQAEAFLQRSGSRLQDARSALESYRLDISVSNSIESIEFSAKAAFLLLHGKHPRRHEFTDEEVAALLDQVPDQARHYNFPRLFVLRKFWSSFYTLSKYGYELLDVPAKDLFQRDEALLASAHARQWLDATHFLRASL